MTYCKQCGEEMEDAALTCPKCGAKKNKQNSKEEGALYEGKAAQRAKAAEEQQKETKKKNLLLAVGFAAGVVVIVCAILLGISRSPEQTTAQPKETPTVTEEQNAPEEKPETSAEIQGECGDGVFWKLNPETGILTISGAGSMTEAPWQEYKDLIKEVIVEDGVQSIVTMAFSGCENLQTVILPNTLTTIEDYAFEGCTALIQATYTGTEEQWAAVTVGSGNDRLTQIVECIPTVEETVETESEEATSEPPAETKPAETTKPVATSQTEKSAPQQEKEPETMPVILSYIKATHSGSYTVGDSLNRNNLTVTAYYSDGSSKKVSDYSTSAGNFNTSGTHSVTVTYIGKSCTVNVTVKEKTVILSKITASHSGNYTVGDSLNRNNLTVTAYYSDGASKRVYDFTVAEPTFTRAGTYEVRVSYGTATCWAEIIVKEKVVTLTKITASHSGSYTVGDILDKDNLSVWAYYSDGSSKLITSGFTCSPVRFDLAGEYEVTITYEGKTAKIYVEVVEKDTHDAFILPSAGENIIMLPDSSNQYDGIVNGEEAVVVYQEYEP